MLFSKDKSAKKMFEDANNWYLDRYETIKIERNRYFLLLIISLAALVVSLLANLMLSPLKTAVPYLIEIDKTTGITTVLQPTAPHSLREQPSVTTYFLYKYLNARMSYDWGLRQANADIVRALSAAKSYQSYAAQMDVNNPQSPIKLYGDNKLITVHVTSHSMPYPNIAEIHFYSEIMDKISSFTGPSNRQYWVATIKYAYSNSKLSLADRENINPLGFFVTDFQLNQDTPGGISS